MTAFLGWGVAPMRCRPIPARLLSATRATVDHPAQITWVEDTGSQMVLQMTDQEVERLFDAVLRILPGSTA